MFWKAARTTAVVLFTILSVVPPASAEISVGELVREFVSTASVELSIPESSVFDENLELTPEFIAALESRPEAIPRFQKLLKEMVAGLAAQGAAVPDSQTAQSGEADESEDRATESAGSNAPAHTPGLAASQIRGVYYDWGEKTRVYSAALGMTIIQYEGGGVYLILKDGTAVFQPDAPPSDFDLNTFKRANPDKVTQLKHLVDVEEQYIYPPRERGYTVDIYVERPSTSASSASTFSTWKKLRLTKDGRFEMGKTSLTSSSLSLDTTYGAENTGNYASSADKTGKFTAGSTNLIGGSTSMVRRANGNTGEFTGTYLIDGNTIELRYDNGAIVRSLFGTDGIKKLILGDLNYWTPKE